jgi:hypothetical protein
MLLNPFILEKAVAETLRGIPKNLGEKLRKRHRNAVNKASQRLLENPYINYENGKLLILSDTKTDKGEAKFYETGREDCRLIEPGNFLCHAFWEGFPCWHRATLEIVEKYLLIENELNQHSSGKSVAGVDTLLSPA